MGTVTLRGEEVFSAGEYNGDAYTEGDLDAMVAAFQELKGRLDPPVKLGHNDQQSEAKNFRREDGRPALGWVENLRRKGSKLVCDFVQVPQKVADAIQSGAYKKKSAEIYWNFKDNGKTYRRALKAVALLGADTPANRDIASLSALYDEQGQEYRIADYDDAGDAHSHADPESAAKTGKAEGVATLEEVEQELSEFGERLASATKGRVGAPAIRQFLSEIRSKMRGLMAKKKMPPPEEDMPDEDEMPDEEDMPERMKKRMKAHSADADTGDPTEIDRTTEEVKRNMELEELTKKYSELESTVAEQAKAFNEKLAEAETAKATAEANAKSYADKLAAVETSLADEKKQRRMSELRAVAARFPQIPGTTEEKAEKLYALESYEPKLYEERVAEWTAVNAQLGSGDLFRQASYAGHEVADGPVAAFNAEVKKLTDAGKNISDATVAVAEAQPKLYAEYQREHERRAKRAD